MNEKTVRIHPQASVLWLIFTLIVLTGLSYITVMGLHANSLQIFGTAFVFIVLLLISLFVIQGIHTSQLSSEFSIPMGKTLNQSALFFMVGFFGWMLLSKSSQEVSLGNSVLLEVVNHKLPPFWDWFLTAIVAPFVEENWFLLAMPALLMVILNRTNEELKLNMGVKLRILVVMGITALTFANFHVGVKMFTIFALSAIAFRSLQILLYWADLKIGLLTAVDFIPAFAIGVHMSNNINASIGYTASVYLLLSHSLGLILLLLFVIMLYLALNSTLTILFIPESRKELLCLE